MKRVSTVNDKNGPFDYLLCVGDFFGPSNNEWNLIKNGTISVPVTTYVLGPNSDEHISMYSDINGCELCPNISYLGKRGIFTTSNGLRIAYVSGQGDGTSDTFFSENDVMCVRDVCHKGQSNFKGVDILVTSCWPNGVSQNHQKAVSTCLVGRSTFMWLNFSKLSLMYSQCSVTGK